MPTLVVGMLSRDEVGASRKASDHHRRSLRAARSVDQVPASRCRPKHSTQSACPRQAWACHPAQASSRLHRRVGYSRALGSESLLNKADEFLKMVGSLRHRQCSEFVGCVLARTRIAKPLRPGRRVTPRFASAGGVRASTHSTGLGPAFCLSVRIGPERARMIRFECGLVDVIPWSDHSKQL